MGAQLEAGRAAYAALMCAPWQSWGRWRDQEGFDQREGGALWSRLAERRGPGGT